MRCEVRTKPILSAVIALLAVSCTIVGPDRKVDAGGHIKVGFYAGREGNIGIETRTSSGSDGLSTSWSKSDEVALWAVGSGLALDAVPFSYYGSGFFTAELPAPMEEGTYSYYASYPVPLSHEGTRATFVIPSVQDGRSGDGEDIMLAGPVSGPALSNLDWLGYDHGELNLEMQHMLHRLRFYCEASEAMGNEPVQRIVATFPKPVAGTATVDITDPAGFALAEGGESTIDIVPETPLSYSTATDRRYLTASIIPVKFEEGQFLDVRLYTASKEASVSIPLLARSFQAGHSTPVKLVPSSVNDLFRLYFSIASNNLGESVDKITLGAPEGCRWADNGSETYVYEPGTSLDAGSGFELEFRDESAFRSLSAKGITVTYDSEHVRISESIPFPDLSSVYSARIALNVPYLLFEDFSNVASFSYDDAHSDGLNTGDKSGHSFLDGWSGARIGASAGQSIRIACRRETSARYPARVDSAPLGGVLKKAADLSVEFDYGADNAHSGIEILTSGDVGQDCYIGYITSKTVYSSSDKDGVFDRTANHFYVHEHSGSYTETPNKAVYVLRDVPVTDVIRISWRTESENQAGANNTTSWLYIDNVKIKIAGTK